MVEPLAKKPMAAEEWRIWVQSMAENVTDPSFERPSKEENGTFRMAA